MGQNESNNNLQSQPSRASSVWKNKKKNLNRLHSQNAVQIISITSFICHEHTSSVKADIHNYQTLDKCFTSATNHPSDPSNHPTLSIPCKSRIPYLFDKTLLRSCCAVPYRFSSVPAGYEMAAEKWPRQIRWYAEVMLKTPNMWKKPHHMP